MNVGVLGLWHLGAVTAAGLAALGHRVTGLDFDAARAASLGEGIAPVFEPGLEEMLKSGLAAGNLRFCSSLGDLRDIDLLWVTFDTPIDEDDNPDVDSVLQQIQQALPELRPETLVLISSQLPVGSIRRLERAESLRRPGAEARFACSPENLRLGHALADFMHPQRIVAGVRSRRDRELLQELLGPLTESIEWMSVESAEMTKHAINAFFAASVVFANEIAALCERVGADAKEVERGLKSESRIGPRAYLAPGAAFAGGTLARDIAFLERLAEERGVSAPLLSAVRPSNDVRRLWVQQRLRQLFDDLSTTTIAIWGLTYKPGTDTLRRSASAELCDWLIREGAAVHVHDPLVKELPQGWRGAVQRFDDPMAAVRGAHALVVATEWPLYRRFSADELPRGPARLVVIDANRFLAAWACAPSRLTYIAVGMPQENRQTP